MCIVGFLKECLLSAKGWDSLPIIGLSQLGQLPKTLVINYFDSLNLGPEIAFSGHEHKIYR